MPSSPVHPARPLPESARSAALSVLLALPRSEQGADELLNRACERARLDDRDRALAMELTYGVLRRQGTIDWRLSLVLDKPLGRLPVLVQALLRLGAYQLLYLDRIPQSAAVNESVRTAKSHAAKLGRDWSGLVNAVLRSMSRTSAPPWPDPRTDPVRFLSIRYSMPEWLSRRWHERLGFARAEELCRTASETPPVTLRVNRLKTSREDLLARLQRHGINAVPTMVSSVGIRIQQGGPVRELPGYAEGWLYVEDEAAQLVPLTLDPHPGESVLDACAAPGGKTTHLAELMHNEGRIWAMDRKPARLAVLEDNCRRLGATIVAPVVGDARRVAETLGTTGAGELFDRILVDAPCSGLGVLRRHPEAKWKKDAASLARHHEHQSEILASAAPCLRPGGVLVYSTCSTEPEENEEVVDRFCRAHAEFRRESLAPWLPPAALPLLTARGDLSTMGNAVSMDAFYAARLRRLA